MNFPLFRHVRNSVQVLKKLTSIEDYRGLTKNKWGIPEPTLEENRENCMDNGGLDLIIMPGKF